MKTTYQTLSQFLFAAALVFFTTTANSATVLWTGGGGDNLWSTDANWDSGAVPTTEDDVIINVPGNPVITFAQNGAAIRSLQCAESLVLDSGNLTLAVGASSFNGPLTLLGGTLTLDNGVVANAAGTTTFVGTSLYAYSGAKLWLTNVTTLYMTNASLNLWAYNADAAIYLANLTNIVSSPDYTLQVYALEGGEVDMRGLRTLAGRLDVNSRTAGSVVNLSALSGTLAGPANSYHSLYAQGGTILLPNVTGVDQAYISISREGQLPTAQWHTLTRSSLSVDGTTNDFSRLTNVLDSSFYASSGAKFWLTNLTTLFVTNASVYFQAYLPESAIYLPNVTNAVISPIYILTLQALEGGLVDLRRLRNPSGRLDILSRSTESVVDLSALSGTLAGPEFYFHSLNAQGGTILLPNVTGVDRTYINISGDSQLATAQWHAITRSSLTVDGVTKDFGRLTNVLESSFYAYNGAKLWLTNLTTLYVTNANVLFQAYQPESAIYLPNVTNAVISPSYGLRVQALEGGLVDLHRLRNPTNNFYVLSRTIGSVVDLSAFSGTLAGADGFHSIDAEGGAILMPNVTALDRTYLNISGDGQLATAQWRAITRSSLTVSGTTNDFSQLTNLLETSCYAYYGAKLWLTNLTTLYVTNASVLYQAYLSESAIYLSNVTNVVIDPYHTLSVQALEGGVVDLHRLRNPTNNFYVLSRTAGSVVDLSAFSGTLAGSVNGSHSLDAQGGAILMPNVTALDRTYINISGEGQLPTAQWRTITRSSLTVSGTTNDFSQVTNLLETSCYAYYGAKLWLTNLTTLYVTNANVLFQAYQPESAIYLSNVTNAVIGPYYYSLSVQALEGGLVDLHKLSNVSGGSFGVLSRTTGSVVDLSGLSVLTPRLPGTSLTAESGGLILLNDTALLLANVALNFETGPHATTNTGAAMLLYGHLWHAYRIEARDTRLVNAPWTTYLRVAMTNTLQTIAPLPPADLAFRVTELVAEPPEVDILRVAAKQTQLIVFGVPGQSYRFESKPVLSNTVAWLSGASVTLTNAFSIQPAADSAEPARYHRARKL